MAGFIFGVPVGCIQFVWSVPVSVFGDSVYGYPVHVLGSSYRNPDGVCRNVFARDGRNAE